MPGGTSKMSWHNKVNGFHKGNRVYIVGSGPSLLGFDFDRLKGRQVIAVNHSIEHCPAQILVFGDRKFLNCTTFDITTYPGMIFCTNRNAKNEKLKSIPKERKFFFEPTRQEPKQNAKNGLFHPTSSGILALNLAIQMNAREIFLLGFDYKYDGNITHFFGNKFQHHAEYEESRVLKKTEKFEPFKKWSNIIFNCCPDSKIKEFRKIGLYTI